MERNTSQPHHHKRRFTSKRQPYNANNAWEGDWYELFRGIETGTRGSLARASRHTNIKKRTMSHLYQRYRTLVSSLRCPDTPQQPIEGESDAVQREFTHENRGGHNRIFTSEQEASLASYVRAVYFSSPNPTTQLHDRHFRTIALEFHQQSLFNPHMTRANHNTHQFTCSPGWITDFKRRQAFASRIAHIYTPPVNINDIGRQEVMFLQRCEAAIQRVGKDRVINIDETRVLLVNPSTIAWADKRDPKPSTIDAGAKEKKGMTFVPCITASGKKLKSMVS
jgi:hypothetical protein